MKISLVFLLLFSLVALSSAEDETGFKPICNGRDLSGWLYRGPVLKNNAWSVENGILKNELRPGKTGTDIYTESKYSDFSLKLEFMVPEGSNSGVYLRGRYEIQLTGDYSQKKLGPAGNGAIFNVKAPSSYASKPSGEWQNMEATIVGNSITVILNGTKIHDKFVCVAPTAGALDTKVEEPGPILLQGRLGSIKFRNLRIKEIPH